MAGQERKGKLMARYSIGEIEKLTGIKPHVLRYWEEVIPSLTPQKGLGGRREYSQHDLDVIQRLKYLIFTKKFTIDGARRQLIHDSSGGEKKAAALQAISEIREELGEIYLALNKAKSGETQSNEKK